MVAAAIIALVFPILAQAQSATSPETLQALLSEGFASFEKLEYAQAESTFQKALGLARSLQDQRGEAEASRGLGRVANARANFPQARDLLTRALELHAGEPGAALALARTRNDLAYTEWATGHWDAATRLYEHALAGFEAAGHRHEVAKVLYNLAFMSPPASGARPERLQKVMELAEEVRDLQLAGKANHLWGDALYQRGDLRGALAKLNRALALLEAPRDRLDRARVLISLSRIYVMHHRLEAAIRLSEQALALQRALGDKQGMAYSLGGIAASYRRLGNFSAAAKAAEQAVAVARQTGSAGLLSSALLERGVVHLEAGEPQSAAALLQEAVRLAGDGPGTRHLYLAASYLGMGRAGDSLQAAQTALAASAKMSALLVNARAQFLRARALDRLGRGREAVQSVRDTLALHERLRARTVPTDYLKRGYGDGTTEFFDFAVDVLFRQGLKEEALTAAEQGRARAFLDLLASRSLEDSLEQAASAAPTPPPADPSKDEPHVASFSSVQPLPAEAMREMAAALKTTLLVYWVGREAAFVWAVPPSGAIEGARIPASAATLTELVGRAVVSPAGDQAPPPLLVAGLRTRGGSPVAAGSGGAGALRELHRLLIQPVAGLLKAERTTSLLVAPHGPLHRLSFAALQDERNRYLLEDYAISYTPAVSTLRYLAPAVNPSGGYLLVSSPASMPRTSDGRPLPELPGARRESAILAGILKAGNVVQLTGAEAAETSVRQRLSSHRVVHFATHGVLIDDRPFDSFLALGVRTGGPAQDGRLTVREIYDLKVDAELVVLSACRTAAGPVTGDGIVGLTRAFFYAGAGSILATLWDVADEPTLRLIASFYRQLARGRPKSEALRSAQLELLSALRKGQITVDTTLGRTVLAEHPMFWAGFIVLGRP